MSESDPGDINIEHISSILTDSINSGQNYSGEYSNENSAENSNENKRSSDDDNNNNKRPKQSTNSVKEEISELDLQFAKAIEDHHRHTSQPPESVQEQSETNSAEQPQLVTETTQEPEPQQELHTTSSSNDINTIADHLAIVNQNQNQNHQTTQDEPIAGLSGIIPADSELLKSSTFSAFNMISGLLPSAIANVQLSSLPLPIVAPDYIPPRIQLLINTLPNLDNLATQLLRIVAVGPYQKIIDLASNASTPAGAAYRDLTSLFEFTKRLYSEEDPFLTVEHVAPGMWKEGDETPNIFSSRQQSIESTLRKVNLATFLAATLGTIEVGFFYLNESFLDVFCPLNDLDPENSLSNMSPDNSSLQTSGARRIGEKVGKLLKPQSSLYLDLKTQAYISAVEAGERSHEEILDDIFPTDLEAVLARKRDVKYLSPVEQDFVNRCVLRKDSLLKHPEGKSLSEEYEWFTFLNSMFDYASKNMAFLIWGKKGRSTFKPTVTRTSKKPVETRKPSESTPVRTVSTPAPNPPDVHSASEAETNEQLKDISSALLPSEIREQQIQFRANGARSLNRRPWTREEEKALRHALELKGPSWATILDLFGPGGKVSEVLKNRNQVQLKDKARNWKMFFLKSGLPVPTYLQKVTGDLERDDKSRARNARNKKTAAAPVPDPAKINHSDKSETEKK